MLKKIIFTTILLCSSCANAEHKNQSSDISCKMGGKVDLPTSFLKEDLYIGVYNINGDISMDGHFCLDGTVEHRHQFPLYVMKDDTIVLKNTIYRGADDFQNLTISLDRAVAENSCYDEDKKLCGSKDVLINEKLKLVEEYANDIEYRYYKEFSTKFDYKRIEKKMAKKKRNIEKARGKEIIKISADTYFQLDGILKSTNYKSFNYKKSIIRKELEMFKNNNTAMKGLTNQSDVADTILTHWSRYLFYTGADFKNVGALYSNSFKAELIESEDYQIPLKLSAIYKNNLRNGTKVRGNKDKRFFEDTTEELEGMFLRKGGNIYNLKPESVNIEFIFEEGAWRLDKLQGNEKYFKSL